MAIPRVAILAGTLGFGGVERQLYYAAVAHRELGGDIRVFSFTRGEFWERELVSAGIQVSCVGERPIVPLRLGRLVRQLKQYRPDLVLCEHFYTSLYGIAAARMLGAREIGAIKSDLRFEIRKPDPLSARLSLRMLRRIVINSRAALQQTIEHGVPPGRLHYFPTLVDTDQFRPGAKPSGGAVRLLAIGRMDATKRFDRLLSVLSPVARRACRAIAVTIVGDGPLRPSLEAQARRLNLTPNPVSFLPPTGDVALVYRDADIFVLTSDCEGTPNVVLEAMASGLPVVATAVGGVPDIVQEGGTGYLAPKDSEDVLVERILQLVDDEGLRRRMGSRGREYVESCFPRTSLPGRLEALYRWAQSD